jgi:DNA-binding PadR family transcriptional regulator
MKEADADRDPRSLLPLTTAIFHIMLALAEEECHGYGIMLEVEKLTAGQIKLGPGTLYRSLQRMLVEGLIEERDSGPDVEDERRRCYRLTELGRNVACAEARRLAALARAAKAKGLLDQGS